MVSIIDLKSSVYNNNFIKELLEKEDNKEEDFIDWFIFEKLFNNENNLKNILENIQNQEIQNIVSRWNNSIFSIFKLKKVTDNNFIMLNIINNNKYDVLKDSKNLVIGDYYIARLLPYNSEYIFSNLLYKLNIEKKDEIYTIMTKFELDYPTAAFVDNENKINLSLQIQELEYKDFIDFFGSDEIIIDGKDIEDKLIEFYHYRYFQKKEKTSGKTIAKLFREKYGSYPTLPNIEIPNELLNLPSVGVLYDIKEGLNFLPWYGLFKEIFNNIYFKEIPGYKDCILAYLKSDSISSLPFRRVLRNNSENFIEVMKDVLELKEFDLFEDFEKIMNTYGKNKLSNNLKPTIIPVSDKTKALLRTKKPEEYGILNFLPKDNNYKSLFSNYKVSKID